MKNGVEVTFTFSSNVVGDSNDENNFLHKLANVQFIQQTHKYRGCIKLFQMVPF